MIDIKNLKVWVWDKEILKWVSMKFEVWKNYCLLWKNGSGKSTLSAFLMGHPKYNHISWEIDITSSSDDWSKQEKLDLIEMSPEDRSKQWIFLSFQSVPEIKWIKLREYLRTIYNVSLKNNNQETREISPFLFNRIIKNHLEELHIDESFLDRELNVWFSWWEKRKIEILQMKLIWPKYIILDEIDSWLDLDAFRTIASMLKNLASKDNSFIIITHYFKILDYIDVDKVYLLEDWKVVRQWEKDLAWEISEKGFGK